MLPVYFFTILFLFCFGALFCFIQPDELFKRKTPAVASFEFLQHDTFLAIAATASMLLAIIKIFLPIRSAAGMTIYFFGDLFPITALVLCFIILGCRYLSLKNEHDALVLFFTPLCTQDKIIGYLCFVIGIIHLLFSHIILL